MGRHLNLGRSPQNDAILSKLESKLKKVINCGQYDLCCLLYFVIDESAFSSLITSLSFTPKRSSPFGEEAGIKKLSTMDTL